MPAWIHGRAEHILAKNPSMPKSEAFAIATQQSHATGKSPKNYGTLEGRERAREKYKTPGDDKKTANPGRLSSPKMEKKGEDEKKEHTHPNLRKYLIGAGAGMAGAGARAGMALGMQSAINKDVGPHTAPIYDKLKSEAPVPVLENKFGLGGNVFFQKREHMQGMEDAFRPEGGVLPRGPQVHVGNQSPSVLAHELGHARINESRMGRLIQNKGTILANRNAGTAGAIAGMASGALSDDPRVHNAALAVPALATLPTLASEAGATISAMRRLRSGGADSAQMRRALGALVPAWGTYAAGTGIGMAGALANQGIGGAIRHEAKKSREKKEHNVKHAAINPVTFAAFADEMEQLKIAGVFDKLLNGIGMANRGGNMVGGTSGAGPSAGFQAFQQQRQQQMQRPAPAPAPAAPARGMAPAPAAGGAPRALPPMNQPLNPTGMNVMFAPKRPPVMGMPMGTR